ncbi:MAG: UTP--glucose-1-phosphate uridylyltransferase GalU [Bacilli bacterium]|nr:UTP--glucose-1-phosphate uridylyltransferase GalU [Bacilli bacterium]
MIKIRKAVIPVAGMGTRFLPVTKSVPKEMLPIVDKPTLQYIVEEAVESGIEEILFITSSYKKIIEDHFDVSYELESKLKLSNKIDQLEMVQALSKLVKASYIRQGEPLGSGHAIRLAKTFVGNEPFAVLYGDDIMYYKNKKPVLKQLIEVYEQNDCNVIGVQQVKDSEIHRYGIIKYSDEATGKIETIIEKPKLADAPSKSAGLGRYIVKPSIFDKIDHLKPGAGNEIQFTDAMMELMKEEPFYACKFDGDYYDVGSKIGYIKANINYALDREDLSEDLKEYMKKVAN